MFISIGDMGSEAKGVDSIDISTKWDASTAIEAVNKCYHTGFFTEVITCNSEQT